MIGTTVKLFLINIAKYVENIVHTVVTRYLIKNYISAEEVPFWKWFSPKFLLSLQLPQILSLLIIAGFTLVTFPLGVWQSSFSAAAFFPLTNIFYATITLFLLPFQLWGFNKTVGEFTFNQQTVLGLAIVEVAVALSIVGWWFIYQANV